jgi:hypothetical protein
VAEAHTDGVNDKMRTLTFCGEPVNMLNPVNTNVVISITKGRDCTYEK